MNGTGDVIVSLKVTENKSTRAKGSQQKWRTGGGEHARRTVMENFTMESDAGVHSITCGQG